MQNLLNGVSVDTDGTGVRADGAAKNLSIWATSYGGGTVTFQVSPDDGTTWITPNINGGPAQFTANATVKVDFVGAGQLVRATLTSSSGASNVNAAIF